MPRMRTLKPEFFSDPDVCALSPLAVILYEGLWCHADRDGRLEDKPRDLALKILPMRQCDVGALLDELAQHKEGRDYGFILRYQSGGRRYLQLWKLGEHQHFHHKEESRGLPPPPRELLPEFMTPGQPGAGPPSNPPQPQASLGQAPDQPRVNPSGAGTGTGTDKRRAPAASPPGHPSENSDCLPPRPTPPLPEVGLGPTQGPPEAHPPTSGPAAGEPFQSAADPGPTRERPKKAPADPRYAPVRAALERAFLEATDAGYVWQGEKDGPALKHLLGVAGDEEILRRWRLGLELGDKWPGCRTVAQLRSKWNELAGARPSAPPVRDTYGLDVGRGAEPEGPRFGTCEACATDEAQGSTQHGHFFCRECWSECWDSVPDLRVPPAELEAHVLAFLARKRPAVPEAIVARWRMAIDPGRTSFPPDIANLYELLPPHWNRFVPPQAPPEPDTTGVSAPERSRGTDEAESAWTDVLADVRESGKRYALSWLDRLTPVRIAAGALELAADDGYFRDWAEEHYGGLLGETAGRTGSLAVRIVVAEPGHFGPDGPRPTPAVPDPPFTPVPPPRLKPVPAPERETAKPRVHVGKRKAAHA